ncbi:MAG: hypothetical protein ONB17_10740 [candidate division KSB1 bacterium]|nr:hypothetical protein [candidate division KSB1 bacterium]MDZ7378105.1 hypothetical protein [candidate division KSB1 bacterium]
MGTGGGVHYGEEGEAMGTVRACCKRAWLALLVLVPAALLLADAEDRQERDVGGVWCVAISHVNEPVWDGKSWYMSGYGISEAETAIPEIGLSSELRIDWLTLKQEDYRRNSPRAYTSAAYNWCPPWQEVCYSSDHTFVVDHKHTWYPHTTACIARK